VTARLVRRVAILQPNETATITVQVDTRRFLGAKSRCVWVTVAPTDANAGFTEAEVPLTVKAVSQNDPTRKPD
jgi:hypothetical protein